MSAIREHRFLIQYIRKVERESVRVCFGLLSADLLHRRLNLSDVAKTKYARSGDVRIAYQITGDGPFDVVWAPGTMSHLDLDWEIPQRALFFDVHTGECELMGDNIGGIAVHAGARIMAKAKPGKVVVSRTVKDLVAGSGINFQDLGLHQLKGVPGEWKLFSAS